VFVLCPRGEALLLRTLIARVTYLPAWLSTEETAVLASGRSELIVVVLEPGETQTPRAGRRCQIHLASKKHRLL